MHKKWWREGIPKTKNKYRWGHCNFSLTNPSGRTKDRGSTQPLAEMSTRNISCRREATFMCQLSRNSGRRNPLEPLGPLQFCNGIALPFEYYVNHFLHIVLAGLLCKVRWYIHSNLQNHTPQYYFSDKYKVVQIWPEQTVTCLHTISPGHIWTTLYFITKDSKKKGNVQGGSNMTGTNCDLFTHKSSRSYLNHLVFIVRFSWSCFWHWTVLNYSVFDVLTTASRIRWCTHARMRVCVLCVNLKEGDCCTCNMSLTVGR